jgi:hypothetical protein
MKVSEIIKETSSGSIASVSMPVASVQSRIPKNGLDSSNLMGGPKAKKKKPKSKKA